MYRHLLVPVDGTVLSAANVEEAVKLACGLAARITFFHASEAFATPGQTQALLSKSAASAAALGVPCETVSRACDDPAAAILDAARERGCDLVVMASRGTRGLAGWLQISQTEHVMKHSPAPVLITRVAANDPIKPVERALAAILDEHRSIAVVVRAMRELMKRSAAADALLDCQAMENLLSFLQAFALRLHHPKEEEHLHRRLRLRLPDSTALLSDLERQHVREQALVEETLRCLKRAQQGQAQARIDLQDQVELLADHVWRHIGLEERSVLPLARMHLQSEDWKAVAEAFESDADPGLAGPTAGEFRRLFAHLAEGLPPPQFH